ncbi:efflux transporter outer membrane subunit [Paraburkholderia sp. SEWSISQ10-3 4]|uniref:efflux transporter outer membrane subunit n=1 Tax=Paraburkholderia TaxID=1822464 RepID=UPI00224F83DA|nr:MULTISPECIES: efflux transporter outer membrane subunit [Paraburkholderia]MCX4142855.1 efflux transporter outer membrane subunit [Paraburkholderia aspalathi]MDN7175530.1 efflux transporter outer membrane subunit [Paraburkholderia sp. SEWSISQ10-3 4]MDQ6505171.1 efflux transporter outer membrane subunit [Paraburkholderia aspalathi]
MKPATSCRLSIACALIVSMSVALTGCVTVGPDFKQPDVTLENQWLESLAGEAQTAPGAQAAWWTAFNDPVLSALEQRAYERNLSLQVAGLHIFKARAQLAISAENLLPQSGSVSAGADHINTSGVGPIPPTHLWAEHLRVNVGWEIDFWGKYRRQIESDRAQLRVSEAAYDNALVSLFADVANAYIDLRALEQRIAVAQQNLKAVQQSLTLTQARYKRGASSQLDVEQAATLVAETEAQIPPLIKARAQDRDTLAVLLADPPDAVDAQLKGSSAIPVPPTQIDVGIPADLLRRRPDVRQAALNAAAQSALIGAAKAKLYPSLSLTGLFGLSSGEQRGIGLSQWGSKTIGLFSAGITLPILDRGQLKNAVRIQDAAFQEAVLDYQNTVLQAQKEVEDAIAALRTSLDALAASSRASDASQRALKLANVQYRAGSVTYDTVLDASRSMLRDGDSLAQNQGIAALAAVSLYRALGGGWEVAEGQQVVSEQIAEQMAQRTDWGRLLNPPANSALARASGGQLENGK